MILSSALIRSFAALDEAVLREQLAAAQEALFKGDKLTSVSSGSGTAYTRQITAEPAEIVELLQLALEQKLGISATSSQVEQFITRHIG